MHGSSFFLLNYSRGLKITLINFKKVWNFLLFGSFSVGATTQRLLLSYFECFPNSKFTSSILLYPNVWNWSLNMMETRQIRSKIETKDPRGKGRGRWDYIYLFIYIHLLSCHDTAGIKLSHSGVRPTCLRSTVAANLAIFSPRTSPLPPI